MNPVPMSFPGRGQGGCCTRPPVGVPNFRALLRATLALAFAATSVAAQPQSGATTHRGSSHKPAAANAAAGGGAAQDLAAAKADLENKRYAAAELLYRKALVQQPNSPEVLTGLGIALQLEGASSEAIHSFQEALKRKDLPVTYALLAEEKCKTRNLDGARPMLDRIVHQKPLNARALGIVAPCYLDAGEPLQAVEAYTALLGDAEFPGDLATVQLTKAYLGSAQFFVEKLKAAKDSAPYLNAIQAARDGTSSDARGAFSAAAAASPWFNADSEFTQAVAIWRAHPADTALLYLLSVRSGEESMRYVQICNEKYPDSPYLQQFLAQVLADQGRVEEAAASYESLMQKYPDLPNLRYDLGMLYNKQQQWQKSLEVFQQQLAANPRDERAAARISEALLELQRYSDLREYLRPRVAASHAPLWARLDLATAEQKLDNPAAAIAQLVAAERDDPQQKSVHYRLMRLYTTTGDSVGAGRERDLFQKSPR